MLFVRSFPWTLTLGGDTYLALELEWFAAGCERSRGDLFDIAAVIPLGQDEVGVDGDARSG